MRRKLASISTSLTPHYISHLHSVKFPRNFRGDRGFWVRGLKVRYISPYVVQAIGQGAYLVWPCLLACSLSRKLNLIIFVSKHRRAAGCARARLSAARTNATTTPRLTNLDSIQQLKKGYIASNHTSASVSKALYSANNTRAKKSQNALFLRSRTQQQS